MFAIRSRARTALLELGRFRPTMASAIDRFARSIRRADVRQQRRLRREQSAVRRRLSKLRAAPSRLRRASFELARRAPSASRLRSLSGRHPVPHRLALPPRLSRRVPPTVLERQRRLAGRGGRPPFAESVERGAERVAAAIRAQLLALRSRLGALQRRLSVLTRPRRRAGGY